MTTGQRVAQKRKELGLSQEALGEKLGVSRQSIYKWESDSALPEVEKLVALSRLFGVSVGWLLGVEEEAAPGGRELGKEQLALVEEIAARYAPRPRLSGHRREVVKMSAVTAAVCLCLVLWGFYQRLEDLTRNYSYLQTAIIQVETGVNSQIDGVSGRVEELLREQNAVTADYATTLADVDPSASQAFFQARAVPKNYVEGMTAEFYARKGSGYQAPAVQAEQKEGQRFTADLKCGLAEDIAISVAFLYPDGTRQTQVLDHYTGLYGQTFPAVRVDYALGYKPVENGTFALVEAKGTREECGHLDWSPMGTQPGVPELPQAELESVRVGLFQNKKLVDWAVFTVTPGVIEEEAAVLTGEQWKALDKLRQNGGGGASGHQWLNFCFAPQDVPAEAGDVFQVAAVLRDVYGRTAVRSGGAFGLDGGWKELANLDAVPSDAYPGGWMLEDGSSICSYIPA
ncbi:helix-turn-helix domain-containing protein [uncultured Oscillibacter sp.]|uniref:helix-turn-helix domain-containing protein n=2 Tax=uncultured Oscillibacter sp. TaxID=876091 RepID=UPI00261F3548|nr:helix-turn-helix transcriptional regulator [uncultured Oscillibacter sp.]